MKNLIFFSLQVLTFLVHAQDISNTSTKAYLKKLDSAQTETQIINLICDINCYPFYPKLLKNIPSLNPINPKKLSHISSEYSKNRMHPVYNRKKPHNGIDLAAVIGTPVHSAANGKVKRIEYSKIGYGKNVIIEHKYGFETLYGHMAIVLVLKEGQYIKSGELIGMVGSTGTSTGNHLHYEIRKNSNPINPKYFLSLK